MRVLITGGTGFIGRNLARACLARGDSVGILARGAMPGTDEACTAYPVDLCDEVEVHHAVADFRPNLCFHLAAVPDATDRRGQIRTAIEVNLTGTLNLLEAILRAGRCLTVIGDSVKVYGNVEVPYRAATRAEPDGSYAISKLAAWRLALLYLAQHGLPTVALRPTLVYGPGQGRNVISHAIDQALAGASVIELMGGQQTRDPVFIDDVVAAFLAVARIPGRAYGTAIPASGGQEVTVEALVRRVVALAGARTEIRCNPAGMRRTEMLRSYCDNADAAEMMGWAPRVTLDEGLRATIAARRAPAPRPAHAILEAAG